MSEKKRLEFTLAQVRRELEEEMIERKRIQVELDQMVRLKTFYLVLCEIYTCYHVLVHLPSLGLMNSYRLSFQVENNLYNMKAN